MFLRTNNRVRLGLVHFSLQSDGYFRAANMIALKDYYRERFLRVDLKTAFSAIKKVINNYEDRIRGTSAGF